MRKFLTLLLLCACAAASAQGGCTLEKVDGKYVCQGSVGCGKSDRAIFCGMALWTLDQAVDANAKSAAARADAASLQVSVRPSVQVEDDAVQSYSFNLTLSARNGSLHYAIEKIRCTPKGFFGGITAVSLDKINTEKKPKQKALIDKFATLCGPYVQAMTADIKSRSADVRHWDAITQGQVVKGMTESECVLAAGKPDTVTKNPQRVQWQYESGLLVVFENGRVTAAVK